jgi:hypothetical protein
VTDPITWTDSTGSHCCLYVTNGGPADPPVELATPADLAAAGYLPVKWAHPGQTVIGTAELEQLRSRLAEATRARDDFSARLETEQHYHEETKGYRQHAEAQLAEAQAENKQHCLDFQAIAHALGILEEWPELPRVLERVAEVTAQLQVSCSKCEKPLHLDSRANNDRECGIRCLECDDVFCRDCTPWHFKTEDVRDKLRQAREELEVARIDVAEATAKLTAQISANQELMAVNAGLKQEMEAAEQLDESLRRVYICPDGVRTLDHLLADVDKNHKLWLEHQDLTEKLEAAERELARLRDAVQPEPEGVANPMATDGTFTITLSDYQIANLRELIKLCGFDGTSEGSKRGVFAYNTGDWLGELWWKLQPFGETECKPNVTLEQVAARPEYQSEPEGVAAPALADARRIVRELVTESGTCPTRGCIYVGGHNGSCFKPGDVVPAAVESPGYYGPVDLEPGRCNWRSSEHHRCRLSYPHLGKHDPAEPDAAPVDDDWSKVEHGPFSGPECSLAASDSPAFRNRYCCHACFARSGVLMMGRMILCPTCGNKRCPKASDHELACTGSNESGQAG